MPPPETNPTPDPKPDPSPGASPDPSPPDPTKLDPAETESTVWTSALADAWRRVQVDGISLANKCLLLFGGALVVIVLVALTVPWLRMNALIGEGERRVAREQLRVWRVLAEERSTPDATPARVVGITGASFTPDAERPVPKADQADPFERFAARAVRRFGRDPDAGELFSAGTGPTGPVLRHARLIGPDGDRRVIVIEHDRGKGLTQRLINTLFLLSAGTMVLGLAVLAFYLITHRIILEPVRSLKESAERVRLGRLDTRSDIRTGDEFEELAETFNLMLEDMQLSHDRLRKINTALDMRITELAQTNTALAETARLKGDFLAKVSHELRTPLNSIIGFAELLLDIARNELDWAEAAQHDTRLLSKRKRYLENIESASRHLLELIETLLEMAKIEAGKVDVRPQPMSVKETCEGLLGLISPLAARKSIELELEVPDDVPLVRTDVRKFQQIVFNFLSNAVKFIEPPGRTGKPGRVTLRAELLVPPPDAKASNDSAGRVRVSVIDTGPGIRPEDQARIFDTFEQAEAGYARGHAGTGLGLAICKELAAVIQGEIQLVSELGRGSMFSLLLPVDLDPARLEEMKLERAFRGALSGRGTASAPAD